MPKAIPLFLNKKSFIKKTFSIPFRTKYLKILSKIKKTRNIKLVKKKPS